MLDHTSEHIWSLMAKKLCNEASAQELQELEQLLRDMPQENYAMEVMQDLWKNQLTVNHQYTENQYKELVNKLRQTGVDTLMFHVDDHIISSDIITAPAARWKKPLLFSTILFAILAGFFIFFNKTNKAVPLEKQEFAKNEISTKNGSKTSLVLPDGSKVWLNAGSKLTYNKDFETNNREVWLSGEAYFDVTKNKEKPFIIYTDKMDVKVLGTAFNVKCYPGEKISETSLIRGSVEITLKDRQEKIVLKPNEKLILNGSTAAAKPAESDTKHTIAQVAVTPQEPMITLGHVTLEPEDKEIIETSWVNNKLIFNNENFEEIATKMERWYGTVIEVNSDKLKAKRFSGTFENETIVQALEAMRLTTAFNYTINKDKIIISQK